MSRSAMPAARNAVRTASIRAAFWRIASTAVVAWVTTPALIRTRSGTRATSPVATTSRRVPLIGRTSFTCAAAGTAAADTAAVSSIAAALTLETIWNSLRLAAQLAARPIIPRAAARGLNRGEVPSLSAGDQPVDEQDQDRADDGGEEARAFARFVPAQRLAEETGQHRAGDADHDRDQAAAGIASRHHRLGDGA